MGGMEEWLIKTWMDGRSVVVVCMRDEATRPYARINQPINQPSIN